MLLTIDDNSKELKVQNPDWEQVALSLRKMHPITNCFVSLTEDSGSYIQCAGSVDKLTLEVREYRDGSFKHYVLGKGNVKSPMQTVWQTIECSIGPIRVHDNEVLTLADALINFQSFFSGSAILKEYNKRNVTKNFKL